MTRRRLLVFGLVAGMFALGMGGWLLWPGTTITRENAAKIQKGMTVEQVEAILGRPRSEGFSGHTILGPQPIKWEARGLLIAVWLDNDDLVRRVDVHESERPSRLSQWLDWMLGKSYWE